MPAGASSGNGAPGPRSAAAVTTPSGTHVASNAGMRGPALFTRPRVTAERTRVRNAVSLGTRAGVPSTTSARTAVFRQNRPLPVRTYGMAPVVTVRRWPAAW